jgi:hypothetical protein
MKAKLLLLLFLLTATQLPAQHKAQTLNIPASVQSKNYYLLTLLQHDTGTRQLIEHDAILADLAKAKIAAIREAQTNCKDALCLTTSFKFTTQEIQTAGDRLAALYQPNNALGRLVNEQLSPSYTYSLYNNLSPKEILVKAWQQDAQGINNTIAIYAEGEKPNYPAVDSISFNIKDKVFKTLVTNATVTLLNETQDTRQFFMSALTAALIFLDLNGRDDIISYEPMETTVNKAALQKLKTVNWAKYPYTVILVPGNGPEEANTPIDPNGILRCRMAAVEYLKGMAPFIIVSGGKVHPYKTPYCEAEEMKRYLMHNLNIPESAIIMEPHARHTTTNMRNAVRLLYQYHFPADKAAVVLTDKSQSSSITNMAARCLRELQYVPYKLGKRLSDTEQEFYPVKEARQINATEPLDP